MSLQGVLTDFGVADIFQLISQQQKTGILSVERHERTLEIHFVEGGVLRALPAESRPDSELGALMIRIGLLSDSDLAAAVRDQDGTRTPLAAVLVSRKLANRVVISTSRRLLTDETIFELFLWDAGRFSFRPCKIESSDMDSPVGAEMVLLDALRMRDEWAQIEDVLRDLNVIVKAQVDIEGFRTRRASVEAATGMQSRDLEKIFMLVDGHLSARRVIDLSRMGTFQGSRALAGLLREGLISVARLWSVGNRYSSRGPHRRPLLAGGIMVACAVLAGLLLELPSPRALTDYPIPEEAVKEVRAAAMTERLRAALEAHRWAHGGYPDTLEKLAGVHGRVLAPLSVDRYSYFRSREGYILQRKLP